MTPALPVHRMTPSDKRHIWPGKNQAGSAAMDGIAHAAGQWQFFGQDIFMHPRSNAEGVGGRWEGGGGIAAGQVYRHRGNYLMIQVRGKDSGGRGII